MSHQLPDQLVAYLATREQQRADNVNAFLVSLTTRERALITQTAVMGYVQGVRHPDGERIPKNAPLLAQVIDACFSFPDLYPAISGVARYPADVQETVEYYVQCQQPDGSWVQASSAVTDLARANQELAAQRLHRPEFTFRLAQRHTAVIVHPLPEPADEEA